MSQDFELPRELGQVTFKTSIKNLLDSKRGRIWDPGQTQGRIHERQVKVGRDYSFSLSYTFPF